MSHKRFDGKYDDNSPPAWNWTLTDKGRRVHRDLADIAARGKAS
ncbi:hypothetical protein [Nocardia pseudovaccinii]|nr:hypothetical protein [Nocardia pseudovaccinii]